MTPRPHPLHRLVHRRVVDADGEPLGRIEEVCIEIEQHADGNDYVVREYHVGAGALLEAMGGGRFRAAVARSLGRAAGYHRYVIPWDWMDLSDPERPRVTRRKAELTAEA